MKKQSTKTIQLKKLKEQLRISHTKKTLSSDNFVGEF